MDSSSVADDLDDDEERLENEVKELVPRRMHARTHSCFGLPALGPLRAGAADAAEEMWSLSPPARSGRGGTPTPVQACEQDSHSRSGGGAEKEGPR